MKTPGNQPATCPDCEGGKLVIDQSISAMPDDTKERALEFLDWVAEDEARKEAFTDFVHQLGAAMTYLAIASATQALGMVGLPALGMQVVPRRQPSPAHKPPPIPCLSCLVKSKTMAHAIGCENAPEGPIKL